MRKNYYLVMSLAAVAALSSCKKLGELSADNFTGDSDPVGGDCRSGACHYRR